MMGVYYYNDHPVADAPFWSKVVEKIVAEVLLQKFLEDTNYLDGWLIYRERQEECDSASLGGF